MTEPLLFMLKKNQFKYHLFDFVEQWRGTGTKTCVSVLYTFQMAYSSRENIVPFSPSYEVVYFSRNAAQQHFCLLSRTTLLWSLAQTTEWSTSESLLFTKEAVKICGILDKSFYKFLRGIDTVKVVSSILFTLDFPCFNWSISLCASK